VNDETETGPHHRLPPRIRPTGTSHDVTPPAPATEVKYVSSISPAGEMQAYEQAATFLTGTARGRRLRTGLLIILGLVAIAVLAEKLF
jgi:hypothetical protein